MPSVTVVRTYLEMRDPSLLRGALVNDPALRLERVAPDNIALFRTLYRDVGGPYHWRDRNFVPDDQLRAHFEQPAVQLWVLYHGDAHAGFFELERHPDESVEVVYFGLTKHVFGRGFGKHLLTCAVTKAWELGAKRVWLHTCTLDSPAALPNYLARGFEPFKIETYETAVPDPA
jgi:GNAT superfamily N-acetyltransferase